MEILRCDRCGVRVGYADSIPGRVYCEICGDSIIEEESLIRKD